MNEIHESGVIRARFINRADPADQNQYLIVRLDRHRGGIQGGTCVVRIPHHVHDGRTEDMHVERRITIHGYLEAYQDPKRPTVAEILRGALGNRLEAAQVEELLDPLPRFALEQRPRQRSLRLVAERWEMGAQALPERRNGRRNERRPAQTSADAPETPVETPAEPAPAVPDAAEPAPGPQ